MWLVPTPLMQLGWGRGREGARRQLECKPTRWQRLECPWKVTEPARPALRPAKPTGALGKQRQEATKDKTDPSAQILDQTEWVRQDSPSSAANPTFGLPPALKQSKTKPLCSYFILPFIHPSNVVYMLFSLLGSLYSDRHVRERTHTYTL